MPAQWDDKVSQGTDFIRVFWYLADDRQTYVDLTGYEIRAELRRPGISDPTPRTVVVLGSQVADNPDPRRDPAVNPVVTNRAVELRLTAAELADMTPGSWEFDVFSKSPGGTVSHDFTGVWKIIATGVRL